MASTVLVVEDDARFREVVARALRAAGFRVVAVAGVREAVGAVAALKPDLALVDLRLGDGSGVDVVRQLGRDAPACRAVMLSGQGTIASAVDALRAGAVDFRTKPIPAAELVGALREALEPIPGEALDQVERDHILAVLQATGGNISESARRLGLHRRTLQRKLHKLQ